MNKDLLCIGFFPKSSRYTLPYNTHFCFGKNRGTESLYFYVILALVFRETGGRESLHFYSVFATSLAWEYLLCDCLSCLCSFGETRGKQSMHFYMILTMSVMSLERLAVQNLCSFRYSSPVCMSWGRHGIPDLCILFDCIPVCICLYIFGKTRGTESMT